MRTYSPTLREQAVNLRKQGHTYSEINGFLGEEIPKATFYYWFRSTILTQKGRQALDKKVASSLDRARAKSLHVRQEKRKLWIASKTVANEHVLSLFSSDAVRRVILGTLYMTEGTKSKNGSITFGNSDPGIISLFVSLLRETFTIDESKFRCTLQARADQDIVALEKFWSNITGIPLEKFYTARIDPRSIGKQTLKKQYKGVCRINYFSSDLLCELMVIGSILKRARSSAG